MRQQGRIIEWDDDRGFGFIAPEGGGGRVFAHIGAFTSKTRRPAVDRRVTYELGADPKGRPRAVDVAFADAPLRQASDLISSNKALSFAALVLAIVAGAVLAGKLPMAILGLYLGASVVAFFAYFRDKHAAKRDTWRTPEKTLLLLGLAGGWPGAILAQRMLRHKSRKLSFQLLFWGTVILNCAVLGWLFTDWGTRELESVLRSK